MFFPFAPKEAVFAAGWPYGSCCGLGSAGWDASGWELFAKLSVTTAPWPRLPDLVEFTQQHGLKLFSIADLIRYRLRTEKLIKKAAEAHLPTIYGQFMIKAYKDLVHQCLHLAVVS